MVEWCRRGPTGARVEWVDVDWEDPAREEGFAVQ
jgi:hypothetical protein